MRTPPVAIALGMLLAGCPAQQSAQQPAPMLQTQAEVPSDTVYADAAQGGSQTLAVNLLPPKDTGFQTQAIVHRWVASDVTSYVVKLAAGSRDLVSLVVRVKSGESRATFKHLKLNVSYVITVVAMGNVSGNPTQETRILNSQHPSHTTFTFSGNQDVENSQSIDCQVILDDTTFDGSANVGVGTSDGKYDNPAEAESGSGSVVSSGVTTLAGSTRGYLDGSSITARFDTPYGLACDDQGNVYVSDSGNLQIRKIDAAGQVTTFGPYSGTMAHTVAGESPLGYADGITLDNLGGILLACGKTSVISQVLSGSSTVKAGSGQLGLTNGFYGNASFNLPSGIVPMGEGKYAIADTLNNVIRVLEPSGFVSTWIGNGNAGAIDGASYNAELNRPTGLARDTMGNMYVSDTGNHLIRKVDASGSVSTVAGTGAFGDTDGPALESRFDGPTGIAVDSDGTLYVADTNNHCIRKITPQGGVSTFAGSGYRGLADGPLTSAKFNAPSGLVLDGRGHLLVADTFNHKIRKIRIR